MPDTSTKVKNKYALHEDIKIKILDMVQSGDSPFDIVIAFAQWLERETGEIGYAKEITESFQAVYGLAFQHKRPLEDALQEVEKRKERIEATLQAKKLTPEEETRARFALSLHQQKIKDLQAMIAQTET